MTPNQTVAANLRRIRERNGLTQVTVAERLAWSEESYAQAERAAKGRRVRRFDADDIYALARALDTTVAALLLPLPGTITPPGGEPEPPVELAWRVLLIDDEAQTNLDVLLESLDPHSRTQVTAVLKGRPLARYKSLQADVARLRQLAEKVDDELKLAGVTSVHLEGERNR